MADSPLKTDPAELEVETIAAISTAAGRAGIGIVRLSGPRAVDIARRLFSSPAGLPGSHRFRYGFVRDPSTGETVDEVLLTVMRAPRTYTREDVVEINCHGGAVPLRRVLELALAGGARLAEPGEFTRRAFLNGRIDLSQAEAALDLIRASTDEAERLALSQLRGGLSRRVHTMRDGAAGLLAHVEAHIDFPEEEIEPGTLDELGRTLTALEQEAGELAGSFRRGRLYREGLRTAIVGRPNVGKSSLLNALLREDRAIVTAEPGTTRDTIEEQLDVRGLPLRVVDTAGIREAHQMAEREGVRRSLRAIEEADLVLAVFDAAEPFHDEDRRVLGEVRGRSAILVLNKSDLAPHADPFRELTDVPGLPRASGLPVVRVSARTEDGMDALREAVYEAALGSPAGQAEGVIVTNLRHRVALDAARERLQAAGSALGREPLEIVALELREALDRLGEIVGAVTSEDILSRIFSEFCIGK